ncbi:MAG: hypothetical protein ACOY4H_03445 [Thermodesulfobacteriota bacterium]
MAAGATIFSRRRIIRGPCGLKKIPAHVLSIGASRATTHRAKPRKEKAGIHRPHVTKFTTIHSKILLFFTECVSIPTIFHKNELSFMFFFFTMEKSPGGRPVAPPEQVD